MANQSMLLLLISIVTMGIITFILRAFPTFVPKRILESHLLRFLNYALPLSVMTILIFHSLEIDIFAPKIIDIIAKVLALLLVLLSYILWRNVFLSVIIGVAGLNGALYLIEMLV